MLHKPADAEISPAERQLGKGGELAAGFGGSVGAWRKIVPHDPRSDAEIAVIIRQWRDANPATTKYWKDLARAIRVTMRTGQPILAPAPQPPIGASVLVPGSLGNIPTNWSVALLETSTATVRPTSSGGTPAAIRRSGS
jgi:hypothetical protein